MYFFFLEIKYRPVSLAKLFYFYHVVKAEMKTFLNDDSLKFTSIF